MFVQCGMPSTAMKHLRHLAVHIGPRGSTTAAEKEAAVYAKSHFETLGLKTHWDQFQSPTSGWRPYAIGAFLGLIATGLALAGQPIVAALLMFIVTLSILAELYFQPNPLRLLVSKAESQNVWAKIPAAQQEKRKIVLVGHLDTHRTPWVFTSPRRLQFFRLVSTLGTASYFISILFFLVMGLVQIGGWQWLALLFVPIHLIVFMISIQPDMTPFTAGANDNASGASIVMSLAAQLAQAPLEHLEVWAVCTGCEEVGIYGTQAFIKTHRSDLGNGLGISIDNVGGEGVGVCYTSVEGILLPLKPSAELFTLAEQLRQERPSFNAYTLPYQFLHTDGTCLMVNKIPTLSFVGLTPNGTLPHWHQISDTIEHINETAVLNHEAFILELLKKLDLQLTT